MSNEQKNPKWRVTSKMRSRAQLLRHRPTDAEQIIWRALRANRMGGVSFRRQVPIGPYIVDFVSLARMLIIEIDGGQHYEDSHEARDARRDSFLRSKGYGILRFSNLDVMSNKEGVLTTIAGVLGETPTPTLPRKRERGPTGRVERHP